MQTTIIQDPPQESNSQHTKPKGVATMNKKRFNIIEDILNEKGLNKDIVSEVLKTVCQVIEFDPMSPAKTPEQNRRTIEYRKKKAEELCASTYELFKKSYYDTHKDTILEKRRIQRASKNQEKNT